ncbi:hypothetical protein HK405_002311, partial [Cladochytrium tenue]
DVYPSEPFTNGKNFDNVLRGCPNTILTPHIGGSTEEAQTAIGGEVGAALARFIATGATLGAVNFPEVELRRPPRAAAAAGGSVVVRIANVHQNVPGVLKQINRILADFNIEKQICESTGAVGYLLADVRLDPGVAPDTLVSGISAIPESIRT